MCVLGEEKYLFYQDNDIVSKHTKWSRDNDMFAQKKKTRRWVSKKVNVYQYNVLVLVVRHENEVSREFTNISRFSFLQKIQNLPGVYFSYQYLIYFKTWSS